jgi:hypothetical protein
MGGCMSQPYAEGEDSLFVEDGVAYRLDPLLRLTATRAPTKVLVRRLVWILEFEDLDPARVARANMSVPLIVTRTDDARLVVVDGVHRLQKAVGQGATSSMCKFVTRAELEAARV